MEIEINIPPEIAERRVDLLLRDGLDVLIKKVMEYVGLPVLDNGKYEFHGQDAQAMEGVSLEEFFKAKRREWN